MSKQAKEKVEYCAQLPIFDLCTTRELWRIASAMTPIMFQKNDGK
jgi:hypothetical protein